MPHNINVNTLLYNTALAHKDLCRAIDNIIYIIESEMIGRHRIFSPFRIDMGVIILCSQGSLDLNIDMLNYKLEKNGICIIMPGQIIKYNHATDDYKGTFLLYSTEFLKSINFPINIPLVIFDLNNPVLMLSHEQFKIISSFCNIITEISESSIPNKKEVSKYLCIALILSYKTDILNFKNIKENTDKILSRRFLRILGKNYKTHRDIQFYADELHFNKRYFSTVIKKETGMTAMEWIDDFIVLEAKKLLSTTDLTIKEISTELNFCNQSFFGKFFKRVTGMSPKEYKKDILS